MANLTHVLFINFLADFTASILKIDLKSISSQQDGCKLKKEELVFICKVNGALIKGPLIAGNPKTWVYFLQEILRHVYHFS